MTLSEQARDFTLEDWQSLFYALMVATDQVVGAATAAGCGINPKPLRRIIKAVAQHLADEHDLGLTVSRVFKGKERPSFEEVLLRLAPIVESPGNAIIISFSGHLNHWTVLRNIGIASLRLSDSSHLARVNIANCRTSYEPAAGTTREHIINPLAVLLIAIAPVGE